MFVKVSNDNILANRKEKSNMSQSKAIQKIEDRDRIMERVIAQGDLSALTPEQRVSYYNAVCQSLRLNPLTRPFEYITLDGKLVLYARKDCTEQLRKLNGVSIWKIEQIEEADCWIVTAYAKTSDGREDIDDGIVYIKGQLGPARANTIMKAITKAKRRVTLSICGLGFLDESEIDSIPGAQQITNPEEEAIMTEQESLTLSHRAIGLDHWKCGRALAMQIINLSANLKTYLIDDEIIKSWLPAGMTSRKDLDESEARYFIENLTQRLRLMELCAALANKGVDKETMRMKLPDGIQSLKDLSYSQVERAISDFTHWLKAYKEVVEGSVING
jgi:hypothetical protein